MGDVFYDAPRGNFYTIPGGSGLLVLSPNRIKFTNAWSIIVLLIRVSSAAIKLFVSRDSFHVVYYGIFVLIKRYLGNLSF